MANDHTWCKISRAENILHGVTFNNYLVTNTSQAWPDSSVTAKNTYRYWLPDVSAKIDLSDAIGIRLAYTNTLAYPDYQSFVPTWAYNASLYTMYWNNTALLPEQSHNYDAQVALHNNTIGCSLLVDFLKQIDNEIYNPGQVYLTKSLAAANGYPFANLLTASVCTLQTYINNPFRVNVWELNRNGRRIFGIYRIRWII